MNENKRLPEKFFDVLKHEGVVEGGTGTMHKK